MTLIQAATERYTELGIDPEFARHCAEVAAAPESAIRAELQRARNDPNGDPPSTAHIAAAGRKRAARRSSRKSKPDHEPVSEYSLCAIMPAPENDKVYRPVLASDPAIQRLADSIRKIGVREPIVISTDNYILSGHRRHMAARVAGLDAVPCRVEAVSRADEPERFLQLLIEYNRQREKTLDEHLRESVVTSSPDDAHDELKRQRARRSKVRAEAMAMELDLGEERDRISAAKWPFLTAIQGAAQKLKPFWPVSVRRFHYEMLNTSPLIHASKPGSRYVNSQQCWKRLIDLCARGRLDGQIPWDAIADETRPVTIWKVHQTPRGFMDEQIDGLMGGYTRDLLQSQPNHIEILGEKSTLSSIIEPVAMEFTLPLTLGRGFCSLPPRRDMWKRFKKSGREKLVLIVLSDHDPEGEMIPQSFTRSMIRDFHIDEDRIVCIKAGLTREQVNQFNLPPAMKAKKGSPNYQRFVSRYGELVHELEAIDPTDLQQILRDAINSVLDVKAFNREIDSEKKDAAYLHGASQRAKAALAGMGGEA